MARLIKVKNSDERLKEKKKIRYIFTFDRVLMFLQTVALLYMVYKSSGL